MKKYIYFLIALLISASCTNSKKKKEIIAQMHACRDSIGVNEARLLLYRYDYALDTSVSGIEKIRKNEQTIDDRMAIKRRIWHYNWVLDSLEIELKKY